MQEATASISYPPVPSNTIEMVGKVFGKLTVLKRAHRTPKALYWLCRCECGTERAFRGDGLRSGHAKSCGCVRVEKLRRQTTKHGHAVENLHSSEYSSWQKMRCRCFNNQDQKFKYYGGKGIKVCPQWSSFEQFLSDMGPKPDKSYSIDRIDSNGDYCPENCRWADRETQVNNTSRNVRVTWQGDSWTVTQLARRLGIRPKVVFKRLQLGWSVEEAFTTPVKQ